MVFGETVTLSTQGFSDIINISDTAEKELSRMDNSIIRPEMGSQEVKLRRDSLTPRQLLDEITKSQGEK